MASVQEANIREVIRLAIVKGDMQQAIDDYDDPLTDDEKKFLLSITPDELKSMRNVEMRLKQVHQSTKGNWAGAIW